MPNEDDQFVRANAEADDAFDRLRSIVEEQVSGGARELSVADIARKAGFDLDDVVLENLQIPPRIPVCRFVPWHVWFPWRPLWCWWWRRHYPWYRCCHYWWHRCHWYQ